MQYVYRMQNKQYVSLGSVQSDFALMEDLKGYGYDILTKRKAQKIDRGGGLAVI